MSILGKAGKCRGILQAMASLLFFFPGAAAHALSAQAATEQVRAELVASAAAVQPGAEIILGVQQRIIPHWHTYWLNPGDSGIATRIDWQLPPGASAAAIQWPLPGRFSLGPVTNYGYADEVTLLSAITVPANAKPGSRFPVKAGVSWLVCKEVCIPQEVELALTLPVVAAGADVGPGSPLIEQARKRLPVASPWPVSAVHNADGLQLRIGSRELQSAALQDIWFYPAEWGRVQHGAAQPHRIDGDALVISLQPGEAPLAPGEPLRGVLVLTEKTGTEKSGNDVSVRGFTIDTGKIAVAPVPASAATPGLRSALLLALLGGVLLNLMPCVFPVLSFKALSLLQQAQQSPRQVRVHGLVYSAGILASFALLAAVLIALKAGGAHIGWGFQFQSPLFVLAMAYLMFAIGLNLSGVFSVGNSVTGFGSALADRRGYAGSFFTGVLATIVATPCTAPFMGAALGYALAQTPLVLIAVLLSLGLGLALPYLLLSNWPFLQRHLPRPGVWMERLKQALAFPMYATAAWLVWVLAQQAGVDATAVVLAGMVLIALAAWIYDSTRGSGTILRRAGSGFTAIVILGALLGGYFGIGAAASRAAAQHSRVNASDKNWEPYSAVRLQELRNEGKPVFLNVTAAWCITCLANERVALNTDAVAQAFKQSGVTYLKAEWTTQSDAVTEVLAAFGRSGVPLYVFYPQGAGGSPVVLPQILTPAMVVDAVQSAKPSKQSL